MNRDSRPLGARARLQSAIASFRDTMRNVRRLQEEAKQKYPYLPSLDM